MIEFSFDETSGNLPYRINLEERKIMHKEVFIYLHYKLRSYRIY